MKMFNKINIFKIISNHFNTLQNDNTKKCEFDDILTFLILPLLVSVGLYWFDFELKENAINIIITTLSIFVGLLFNIIVILFDIIKRDNTKKLKNEILRQLLTNISYSIFISILIIIVILTTYIKNECVHLIATVIVYFLIGHFFLTILMILKRMYFLFINELKEIEKDK
ncbi:MAG: hypothetical protein A2X02_05410 [Bacteroidetes bacterium GWF2_29_10]|nr:MAG: hypothetical protein A2X02_05410 [Bacteroidetes bacterium GWF2_29_10]